jgi:hypothetical protein
LDVIVKDTSQAGKKPDYAQESGTGRKAERGEREEFTDPSMMTRADLIMERTGSSSRSILMT